MGSWKTTLAGLLTAVFGFVLFSPDLFARWPWLIALARYATAGGFAAIGILAKDSTVHSTAAQMQDATIAASIKAVGKAVDEGAS